MSDYRHRDPDADYEEAAWRFIAFNDDLTPSEALTLLWLVDNRRQPRYGRDSVTDPADEWAIADRVEATHPEIANALSISPKTVRTSLNKLRAEGVIFKGNRQSQYCFHQPHTWAS